MTRFRDLRRGRPVLYDGRKIAVLRPVDPERAIARARELVGGSPEQFEAMLNEQPYTIVGILGVDRGTSRRAPWRPPNSSIDYVLLDPHDNILVGGMQLGDSMFDLVEARARFPVAEKN